MPLYEYICEACGRASEVLQKLGDPPLDACPHCGGAVKKQISAPAFHLKGTGWYATDYAKKSAVEGAKSGSAAVKSEAASSSSEGTGGGESSGAAKAEPKAEPKSEPKGGAAKPSAPKS